MNRIQKGLGMFLFLGLLGGMSGCRTEGMKTVVEGTVTLDGQPLGGVTVSFLPDPAKGGSGRKSSAVTDKTGHYRLTYEGAGGREGSVVGPHVVLIEDTEAENQAREKEPPKPRTSPKYASAAETPFHVDVKPGAQTIDLALQSNP